MNDSDLQCFNAVETLKEIYLQCPEEEIKRETNTSTQSASQAVPMKSTHGIETDEALPSTSSATKVVLGSSIVSSKEFSKDSGDSPSPSTSSSSQPPSATRSNAEISATASSSSPTSESDAESSTSSSSSSSSSLSPPQPSRIITVPLNANGNATVSPPSASIINSASLVPLVGSNTPPRSRFLPRPDHIIYLDVRNRTSPNAVHISLRDRGNFRHLLLPQGNQQQQQQQQQSPPPAFEQMIRHDLFWDIINPLGRAAGGGGPDRLFGEDNEIEFGGGNMHHSPFNILSSRRHVQRGSISDRGVCCFGRTRQPVQHGVIWIRFNNRPSENRFERFSVRDYKCVTDVSLQHLVQCSPNLVFLDVSGTSVTLEGVKRFKALKPQCKLVAEHLLEEAVL